MEHLIGELPRSNKVRLVGLRSLDGVYDAMAHGWRLDLAATNFFSSNRYVYQVTKCYPEFFL